VDRTVRDLAGSLHGEAPASGREDGKGSTATLRVARGDVVNPDAPQPRLRALQPLEPWQDDRRSAQEVIASRTPTAFLTLSNKANKPKID
jgi:hypothetical protein